MTCPIFCRGSTAILTSSTLLLLCNAASSSQTNNKMLLAPSAPWKPANQHPNHWEELVLGFTLHPSFLEVWLLLLSPVALPAAVERALIHLWKNLQSSNDFHHTHWDDLVPSVYSTCTSLGLQWPKVMEHFVLNTYSQPEHCENKEPI